MILEFFFYFSKTMGRSGDGKRNILWGWPYVRFVPLQSAVCILYLVAVCNLHFVPTLHFVPGLQSAVLTDLETR